MKNLKAFVRYDSTGKIVPGGPIFAERKPKVGNWKEIIVDVCCTTTTTTAVPTTTTTTTVLNFAYSVEFYFCGSCIFAGSSGIVNPTSLTVNTFFYDAVFDIIFKITLFQGMTITPSSRNFLAGDGKNTCAEIICPTT